MGRPDPFLLTLSDIGFLPVRLPRPDIQPLLLMEIAGKDLSPLGDLETAVLAGTTARPVIEPDVTTAGAIQGSRTSRVKAGIGLDLLTGLIRALAGSEIDISAAYGNAESVRFEFADVLVNRIHLTQLDGFLNQSSIRPEMRHIDQLLKDDKIAIVTAVAKSGRFLVTAQDKDGLDVAVDVPVVRNALAGKVDVKTDRSSEMKVAYEGTIPVVFGVQAARLFFDEAGKYSLFKSLKAGSGAVRGPSESEKPGAIETYQPDGIFVNVREKRAAA